MTPGSPSSSGSTLPGVPPPGLKSRQTTPVIPPGRGSGCTACFAPAGTSAEGTRVSPSRATSPGPIGVASSRPPPGVGFKASVEGAACERTPAGLKTPLTDAIPALIAPRSGSCWYMIRQVTPAAKADTAMGMNTTVLNATDQRTRSVRTAKMSPRAVTAAGTTATQMALFLIAWRRFAS